LDGKIDATRMAKGRRVGHLRRVMRDITIDHNAGDTSEGISALCDDGGHEAAELLERAARSGIGVVRLDIRGADADIRADGYGG